MDSNVIWKNINVDAIKMGLFSLMLWFAVLKPAAL